jgi:hypothetical protein
MALPDPAKIDANRAYVVDGASYVSLIKAAQLVGNIQGTAPISVKVAEKNILISLGEQSPNNANIGSMGLQQIQLCLGNANYTMWVVGTTPVAL